MNDSWEPAYGFCAYNVNENERLARALEAIRRRVCAYGGGDRCDCKYGLSVEDTFRHTGAHKSIVSGGETTGCPELREVINRLMHRPHTFDTDTTGAYTNGYRVGRAELRIQIQRLLDT